MSKKLPAAFFAALFAGLSTLAQAQTVTVPNTFSAGAPARAAEVNANFGALAGAINALSARVSKLEGQISAADMVGTYALKGLQVELAGGAGTHVASYVYNGTLSLRADGTGTVGAAQTGTQLNFATVPGTRISANLPSENTEFTWTLAGSILTTTALNTPLSVSNGGRMIMGVGASGIDGTSVLLIMTRLN